MVFIKKIFYLSFFFLTFNVKGQKQTNNWYFGFSAGVSFNTGNPIPLSGGQIVTQEGCSSISDKNGNLLFYTDGITIWNKNHLQMTNGTNLGGDFSSTQSALIIQKPGSENLYYIFCTAADGESNGLTYSIVDISLSSGLGAVTNQKNIQLVTPTCEKLTATLHKNGRDVWIIAHGYMNNSFYSYLLTTSGLNVLPVITNIGTIVAGGFWTTRGSMKASPDGKYIAVANYLIDVQLFDFDNLTGIISNPVLLSNSYGAFGPYGIEFSSSSKVLYVVDRELLYQYDLKSTNIGLSETLIATSSTEFGSMQIATNGKIYVTLYNTNFLSVINNPNIIGSGCDFFEKDVNLLSGVSRIGLPTALQSNFYPLIFTNDCHLDLKQFEFHSSDYDSIVWDFGDPFSGINNNSRSLVTTHAFTDTGTYTITLTAYLNGQVDIYSRDIRIVKPFPVFGNDTTICEGESLWLDVTRANALYTWQDGSTNSFYTVTKEGEYSVDIVTEGCSYKDSIKVNYFKVNLGDDTFICEGDEIILNVYFPNASYAWQDGSTDSIYSVTVEGKYSVIINDGNCYYKDSIMIQRKDCNSTVVLYIPNLFTPNGDGDNDVFIPIEIKGIISLKTKIYNRWGDSVFISDKLTIGWDGEGVSDGVYYWRTEYIDINNVDHSEKGMIQLIR